MLELDRRYLLFTSEHHHLFMVVKVASNMGCRHQAMALHNLLPELGLSLHSSAHSVEYGLRFAKQPAAIGSPNNNHHEQETPLPCPDDSCVRARRQQNSGGQLYTLVLRHHCTQIPPIVQCSGQQSEPPHFFFSLDVSGPPPNSETDDKCLMQKQISDHSAFSSE